MSLPLSFSLAVCIFLFFLYTDFISDVIWTRTLGQQFSRIFLFIYYFSCCLTHVHPLTLTNLTWYFPWFANTQNMSLLAQNPKPLISVLKTDKHSEDIFSSSHFYIQKALSVYMKHRLYRYTVKTAKLFTSQKMTNWLFVQQLFLSQSSVLMEEKKVLDWSVGMVLVCTDCCVASSF